jgi:hypothetical protein
MAKPVCEKEENIGKVYHRGYGEGGAKKNAPPEGSA